MSEPLLDLFFLSQYVFKAEAHGFRTVHEELAKGMTFDLKSNEHSAVRNVLKVSLSLHLTLKLHIFYIYLLICIFLIIKNPLLHLLDCSSPGSSLS